MRVLAKLAIFVHLANKELNCSKQSLEVSFNISFFFGLSFLPQDSIQELHDSFHESNLLKVMLERLGLRTLPVGIISPQSGQVKICPSSTHYLIFII